MSFSQSPARQGLDRLLAVMPHLELVSAEWQEDGPWLLVTLGQLSEGETLAWAKHDYAIFKHTGAVHGIQHDGSVTDDPVFAL